MHDIIKKVPIPTAGVALGLAALGNLLQPFSEIAHNICGIAAVLFVALLVAKLALFPQLIRDDMHNSIMASVSGTAFMVLMQLSLYLAPFVYPAAVMLWTAALAAHLALIVWFTCRFFTNFKLHEVFPTYFICYVGIIVASLTAPAFGMEALGYVLFWFGFACYMVLLALVSYRYIKHEIPESARPLFCIYTAPMSLSIVGYLATAPTPNTAFVIGMLVLAQLFLILVLVRLPHFMRLKFYPSFAAMTFPFVITATALMKSLAFFREGGLTPSPALDIVLYVEIALAIAMVVYVVAHYVRFFIKRIENCQDKTVQKEEAQTGRFSENFKG